MSQQQFCLKWNNHMNNMMDVFKSLLSTESMVDVTLACDGLSLKAHKMVLSACSPFFQALFLENPCKHPIVILKDMKYTELKAIIEFMYHGEVNVAQDQLSALMKTAETLRVKGLAEVTNERSQPNQNDETPSHRSASRSESPQSSRRRRGRVRKRSFSDSNRSDDSNEPKIKPPSPDIEELSCDASMENSSGQFNLPPQVPMQTQSQNSFHKSVVSQDPHIEEPASADESEFGVEPAKLLEQTLTTDDLSNQRRNRMSNIDMQRRPRSSTDHSSNFIQTSTPSDMSSSQMQQPESPPDIKPELLELEPPMSPVAGPSHSADNSMMMYMDQSSLSSHPGTSSGGYQDNTALVPTDSQPQGFMGMLQYQEREDISRIQIHFCSQCSYSTPHKGNLKNHSVVHTRERVYKCNQCDKSFSLKGNLKTHQRLHSGISNLQLFSETRSTVISTCHHCSFSTFDANLLQRHQRLHYVIKPFFCHICRKSFTLKGNLKAHLRIHSGEKPYQCNVCLKRFTQYATLFNHQGTHITNDSEVTLANLSSE